MNTATLNRTADELQAFNSRELRPLVERLRAARAFAAAERTRVDAYVNRIFAEYLFTDAETGETIKDFNELYRADLDSSLMKEFNARVLAANVEHGWTGNPDHCPALAARNAEMRAEQAVIKSLLGFMGTDGDVYGATREKMLRLAEQMYERELR